MFILYKNARRFASQRIEREVSFSKKFYSAAPLCRPSKKNREKGKAFSRINRPRRRVRRRPSCASSIRNGRPASCAKRTSGPPLLIGLTPRCFAHSARASCAPLVNPSGAAAPRHLPLVPKGGFWPVLLPTVVPLSKRLPCVGGAVGVSRLRGRYTTLSAKPTEGRTKRALRAEQPLYSASPLWYNVGKSLLRMEAFGQCYSLRLCHYPKGSPA